MKFRCKNTGKIIEVKSTPLFSCVINSNLVSAQNRLRHYWTNIKTKKVGLFEELYTDIPQPKDKGILLKDILESEVDEKYYLSDKMLARIDRRKWSKPQIDPDKTGCIGTTNNSGRFGIDNGTTLIKVDKELNKKPDQNKAGCLTGGGHSGGNHSDMDLICVAMRGRETNYLTPKRTEYGKQIRKDYESGKVKEQRKNIQQREDFKTNALTSVQKDNLIIQLNPSKESGGKQPYQQNRVYDAEGQMPALNAELSGRNNIKDNYRIRRLTPLECARLQTIPEDYKWKHKELEYFGYICSGTKIIKLWLRNVSSKSVIETYPIKKLDFATCTTLDLLEQEQQIIEKLTKRKSAKLRDAIEMFKQKNTETFVSCITKELKGMEQQPQKLNNQKRSVNIVIEKLGCQELKECVYHIIEVSNCMEIHLRLKKENQKGLTTLEEMDIYLVEKESNNIKTLWRILPEGNSKKEKLYIILILINWIIERKIYTYAKDNLNIQFYIENLNVVDQNCLSVDISDLRMESILSTSDTQRYKMLGNGWTMKVISHIFSFITEPKLF